jgi:hypothetical protein
LFVCLTWFYFVSACVIALQLLERVTHRGIYHEDWAHAAVPFLLGLTREVSGASLHVPGFGGGAGGVGLCRLNQVDP